MIFCGEAKIKITEQNVKLKESEGRQDGGRECAFTQGGNNHCSWLISRQKNSKIFLAKSTVSVLELYLTKDKEEHSVCIYLSYVRCLYRYNLTLIFLKGDKDVKKSKNYDNVGAFGSMWVCVGR